MLGATVTSTGNVEVESPCSGPVWCVSDPSCPSMAASTCMTSLLGTTWSSGTDGVASLFFASAADGGTVVGGWALEPASACALTKGGTPVTGITTDLFGMNARSATTPTIGAVEYASGTACH